MDYGNRVGFWRMLDGPEQAQCPRLLLSQP